MQLGGNCGDLLPHNGDEPTDEVIVSPDSLHLYFHGCSPHGEEITITNLTSEELVANRCYSDNFQVECLYEGENITETGMIVDIGETVIIL